MVEKGVGDMAIVKLRSAAIPADEKQILADLEAISRRIAERDFSYACVLLDRASATLRMHMQNRANRKEQFL